MSSAFVPTEVLNHMQESHHQVSTSRIEEVPVEPTPAPGFTVVSGPTVEPLHAMHKVVEQQDSEMDKVLGKYHKFMEFATNSAPC